jgi:hypothetical protein
VPVIVVTPSLHPRPPFQIDEGGQPSLPELTVDGGWRDELTSTAMTKGARKIKSEKERE